jgi:hypothetical protein
MLLLNECLLLLLLFISLSTHSGNFWIHSRRLRAGRPRISSGQWQWWDFFSLSPHLDRLWGAPSLLSNVYGGPYPPCRVKQPGRNADHSLPSTVEVKNACSYTPFLQHVFMAWCTLRLPYLTLPYMTGLLLKNRSQDWGSKGPQRWRSYGGVSLVNSYSNWFWVLRRHVIRVYSCPCASHREGV